MPPARRGGALGIYPPAEAPVPGGTCVSWLRVAVPSSCLLCSGDNASGASGKLAVGLGISPNANSASVCCFFCRSVGGCACVWGGGGGGSRMRGSFVHLEKGSVAPLGWTAIVTWEQQGDQQWPMDGGPRSHSKDFGLGPMGSGMSP